MKQVRLPSGLNPLLLDFARHYGFLVKTHRVRRPRTKGKVERAVGFVKESFLRGRTFTDLSDLTHQARLWMEKVNARPHGTTGEKPCYRLSKEKLPPFVGFSPYRLAQPVVRRADRKGFVRYEGSRYSVPPEHCGRKLSVGAADRRVVIRLSDAIVAEHHYGRRDGIDRGCHVADHARASSDKTTALPELAADLRRGEEKAVGVYLARKLTGLSGKEIAEAFGVSAARVSQLVGRVEGGEESKLRRRVERLRARLSG